MNLQYDHKQGNMARAFGVSKDREKAIDKIMHKALKSENKNTASQDFELIVKQAKITSLEEFAYTAFMMGAHAHRIKSMGSMLGELRGLLG